MVAAPGKYVNHIYGEREAGGTGMLYLSPVPFKELGFPEVGTKSYPAPTRIALGAVPPAVVGVGLALGGAYAISKRKLEVEKAEPERRDHHVEFAPLQKKLWTPANIVLAALMAFEDVHRSLLRWWIPMRPAMRFLVSSGRLS